MTLVCETDSEVCYVYKALLQLESNGFMFLNGMESYVTSLSCLALWGQWRPLLLLSPEGRWLCSCQQQTHSLNLWALQNWKHFNYTNTHTHTSYCTWRALWQCRITPLYHMGCRNGWKPPNSNRNSDQCLWNIQSFFS